MATRTFTAIPFSQPEIIAPARGAEQWHDQNTVNIPTEGVNTQRLDAYYRFTWAKIETAQGVYDWTHLMNILHAAIDKRQKVSFGIMPVYHDPEDGVITYDNGRSAYPEYLHDLMQSESVKDWKTNMDSENPGPTTGFGGWVPNYNSAHYLSRLRALNGSLNSFLTGVNAVYKGVKYRDVINSIDIRGYGNFGEWHNGGIVSQVSQIPAGAHATTATLKSIIDAYTQNLISWQLNIPMTVFDANWLQHTKTSPEVGHYALTTSSFYGKLGWRRDNWGAMDEYIDDLLINNNRAWNGVPLNSLIMNVYKYAPINGEPMNSTPNEFADFENQIRKYNASSFGNGNITPTPSTTIKNNFRAASKVAGYRMELLTATANTSTTDRSLTVSASWKNTGIAPIYDRNWEVRYELVNSAGVIASTGISGTKLTAIQPNSPTYVFSETFFIPPAVPNGTYSVRIVVKDKTGFMAPLPLATEGKNADGSYTIGNVVVGAVPANQPPVVTASNVTIKLPTNSVQLAATSIVDPEGQPFSVKYSKVSGSGAVDINTGLVVGLLAGTSVYKISATDSGGAVGSADVAITVQPADVICPPPVVCPPPRTVVSMTQTSVTTVTTELIFSDGSKQILEKTITS